jgi:hypothetical protein
MCAYDFQGINHVCIRLGLPFACGTCWWRYNLTESLKKFYSQMSKQKRYYSGIKITKKSVITIVNSGKGHRNTTHYRLDKRRHKPTGGAKPQVEISVDDLPEIDSMDTEASATTIPKPKKSNVSPDIHAPFH